MATQTAPAAGVPPPRIGVVVIGRNEGERLRRCIASVVAPGRPVVYVDSGSTDDSVQTARALGAEVVALDMGLPFTAARARNAGVARLLGLEPGLALVQFVDGDCEVAPQWIACATEFLAANPAVAVACGRRRERYPDASVYNLLCDMEWDTPVGRAKACGGDAAVRLPAFGAVNGFREDLIAGEEPELCIRLRAAGWEVWRIDAEMTLHDAAMMRFSQWWRRSMRAGFAFAQGAQLHGGPPERHWVRESRSALLWGLVLPLFLLALIPAHGGFAAAGFALYPLQLVRLYVAGRGRSRERRARAIFLIIGKFSEAAGQMKFAAQHLLGLRPRLIEYK